MRYEPSSDVIRITIQHRSSLSPGPGQYYHLYQPFVVRGWWENHPFSLGAYTTPSQPVPAPSENEAISAPPTDAEASKEAKAASSSITSSSGSSSGPAAAAEEGEEEEEDAAAAVKAEDEIQPAGAAARREAAVRHERPDVTGIVAEAAREATEGGARTVVFVCGPAAMADEARAAVHAEMKKGCRRIEYVEDCFRW